LQINDTPVNITNIGIELKQYIGQTATIEFERAGKTMT